MSAPGIEALIGTWRLVRWTLVHDGVAREIGAEGSLWYHPDGLMIASLLRTDGGRPEVVSYAGPWSLAGTQVIHRPTIASEPGFLARPLVRQAALTSAGQLQLETLPEPSASGRVLVHRLLWRRASA